MNMRSKPTGGVIRQKVAALAALPGLPVFVNAGPEGQVEPGA
jgi:hypothetical protein